MNERTEAHFRSIGALGVRREIAAGVFGPGRSVAKEEAEAWIAAEEARLAAEALSRKETREDSALRFSRSALFISAIALIFSVIAASEKINDAISKITSAIFK